MLVDGVCIWTIVPEPLTVGGFKLQGLCGQSIAKGILVAVAIARSNSTLVCEVSLCAADELADVFLHLEVISCDSHLVSALGEDTIIRSNVEIGAEEGKVEEFLKAVEMNMSGVVKRVGDERVR